MKKPKNKVYEDISDVIFTPKKRSLIKKVFIFLIPAIIIIVGVIFILYQKGYTLNLTSIPNSGSKLLEKETKFYTIKTFSRKPCGMQVGGDEIYTDWFEIKGDVWKIKLNSEKAGEAKLSNVRVWYTDSNLPILDAYDSYVEMGTGEPNYDTGEKALEQQTSGPGVYRLRILCWNSNYTMEIQDSY